MTVEADVKSTVTCMLTSAKLSLVSPPYRTLVSSSSRGVLALNSNSVSLKVMATLLSAFWGTTSCRTTAIIPPPSLGSWPPSSTTVNQGAEPSSVSRAVRPFTTTLMMSLGPMTPKPSLSLATPSRLNLYESISASGSVSDPARHRSRLALWRRQGCSPSHRAPSPVAGGTLVRRAIGAIIIVIAQRVGQAAVEPLGYFLLALNDVIGQIQRSTCAI